MREEDTVYRLVVADLQMVAGECLKRELTEDEIKMLSDNIGNHINWYDAIHNAMIELEIK